MLEAVLVIPVIMVILLIVIQMALWAHAAQVAQLAASVGDRTARTMGGGVQAGVKQARAVLGGPGSDVSSSSAVIDVLPGDLARITVTGYAVSIVPGISLPVSAVQVGPIQEFRATE